MMGIIYARSIFLIQSIMPQQIPLHFKKPAVLYHASLNREIKIFEPREEGTRQVGEGPVVFAALDKAYASIFMHPSWDNIKASGYMNDVPYVLIGVIEKYTAEDNGGAIYILPSDTFECNPHLGVGYREWTSKVPVRPLGHENYDKTFDAMMALGVNVYVTDMNGLSGYRALSGEDKLAFLERRTTQNELHGYAWKHFR